MVAPMGLKFSTKIRDASLDSIEASIGAPVLRIYSRYPWWKRLWLWIRRKPTTPPRLPGYSVIAEVELPPDWMTKR